MFPLTDIDTVFSNCSTGEIRLIPDTTDFTISNDTIQGRLEVCINNAWGSVCLDQFFDVNDGGVACRQLNGFYFEGI